MKGTEKMSVYLLLKDISILGCRIIYIICNSPSHSDYINREERKDNLINLIKQTCLYLLYAITFGISLFSIYIILMLGCVLNDSCYYYNGGV